MKLEVGMYVRLDLGHIFKFENNDYETIYEEDGKLIYLNGANEYEWESEITKYSYNIIDLIEEGDYVNGLRVVDVFEDEIVIETFDERIYLGNKDIKSIVTKEQFENIEYKI